MWFHETACNSEPVGSTPLSFAIKSAALEEVIDDFAWPLSLHLGPSHVCWFRFERKERWEWCSWVLRDYGKLIEVFIIDQLATLTGWERSLAFSREWNDIYPHFYRRCQYLAGSRGDTGNRHSLLCLGGKLKEINEDVKGHSELLKVMKGTTLVGISTVVARHWKGFCF